MKNLIKLFEHLRDGNVNPREVFKNQVNFKSDLRKIKKGNTDSKSEEQIRDSKYYFLSKCFKD